MLTKNQLLKQFTQQQWLTLKGLFAAITLVIASFTYDERFYSTIIIISAVFGCLFVPSKFNYGKLTPFWGSIFGVCCLYALSLLIMLFHNQADIINILTKIDPTIQPMEYKQLSYAQSCSLFEAQTPFSQQLKASLDVFALGHFLGWFSKTIILRDFKLLLFASITFEAIEFSLRDVLNNFKECWWDHLVLDIAVFNLLGIVCGFIYLDWMKLERFRWSLRSAPLKYSLWQNLKIFLREQNLSNLQIKAVSNLRNYFKFILFLAILFINDLTIFFLKYIYRIPSPHPLNFMRCIFIGFLCLRAVSEYYNWMQGRQKLPKIHLYLISTILLLEMAVIYMHKQDDLDHAFISVYGKIILAVYAIIFVGLLSKIAVSDIIKAINQRKFIGEPSSKLYKHSEERKKGNQ